MLGCEECGKPNTISRVEEIDAAPAIRVARGVIGNEAYALAADEVQRIPKQNADAGRHRLRGKV
jgi:hypothetical protein